ncbi:MAG: 3-isopropylmalate dehydratase small subunit, partial [Gammaproteobacteria bacterium]
LEAQSVTTPTGERFEFEFNPGLRHRLLNGLDDIGVSLQYADDIKAFEARSRERSPWLFR